jgi:hypothetical protein
MFYSIFNLIFNEFNICSGLVILFFYIFTLVISICSWLPLYLKILATVIPPSHLSFVWKCGNDYDSKWFFVNKYIKTKFFYFLKIILYINISKRSKNIKKMNFKLKNQNLRKRVANHVPKHAYKNQCLILISYS